MNRILRYLRGRRFDSGLASEMEAHLDERIDELIAEGMAPEKAREEARRRFGNRMQLQETCREKWTFVSLDEIAQDLRQALRFVRKSPVFTLIAVSSLALGIGANTVIFSAVEHVLLRSLPYPHADKLFAVWSRSTLKGNEPMHVSAADFYDWRAQSSSFESLSAYSSWPMNLTNVAEPRRLDTELVSATFFSTLGANPQFGRAFLQNEDQEQNPPVVVISHHLWQALGRSPAIVGRQLTLNGAEATVIGVMPAGFAFPSRETDAWVPLSLSASNRANREGRWLSVIARLKNEASLREAQTEMETIAGRLASAYPASNTGWKTLLGPLQEQVTAKSRPILLTLQAGGLLLLLITCANLTNLLLARGASRAREIAVRAALGATRLRIMRQLMVESLVLAALGGSAGIALSIEGVTAVRKFGDGLIPRAAEIEWSPAVALFALGITFLTTVIFGLAPAIGASRADLRSSIGAGTRGTARHVDRRRGWLVAVEVAVASVLLVGAGLLVESLTKLLRVDTGMRTSRLLTARLTLSRAKYPTNVAQNAFFDQLLESVRGLPGVQAAGEISDTPLEGNNPTFEFVLEGRTHAASDAPVQAGLRAISTGYLHAAGIPLLQGRGFTADDRAQGVPVAIVNETMARRYWPALQAIGRRIRLKDEQRWVTVAGIVPDVKHMGLTADEGPVLYIPYAQKSQDWLAWTTLVVRTAGDPIELAGPVRGAIRAIDKNQPVSDIKTLEAVLSRSTAMPRFTTAVIAIVAGFALMIAVVGVYGMLAYTIVQRMPELGIRLTLGARPLQLLRMLLEQAMARVLGGLAAGLLCAWWLARWLESMLFGVRPHDPATFAAVAGVLVAASLAAVAIPASRALKVDAAAAIRLE